MRSPTLTLLALTLTIGCSRGTPNLDDTGSSGDDDSECCDDGGSSDGGSGDGGSDSGSTDDGGSSDGGSGDGGSDSGSTGDGGSSDGGWPAGSFTLSYWGVQSHDFMSLWAIAYDDDGAEVCSHWGNGNPVATSSDTSTVSGIFVCDEAFAVLKVQVERYDDGEFTYAADNIGGDECVEENEGEEVCTCGLAGNFQIDGVNLDVISLGWSTGTGLTTPLEGCDGWSVE